MSADEFEVWFEKGVTDGLPVVPPTRERVERMLAGARRRPDELVGEMPPNYGRLTVEKAAINAVMAGCRPEYLPVLLAAAECACDPAFSLHGMSASTDRKSTRLNSSHEWSSYAVCCLKKKTGYGRERRHPAGAQADAHDAPHQPEPLPHQLHRLPRAPHLVRRGGSPAARRGRAGRGSR